MDLLKRQLAPITTEAWEQIDEEARRVLKLHLAGRKLVDFVGPLGWQAGAVNTGRLKHIQGAPVEHVGHAIRPRASTTMKGAVAKISGLANRARSAALLASQLSPKIVQM